MVTLFRFFLCDQLNMEQAVTREHVSGYNHFYSLLLPFTSLNQPVRQCWRKTSSVNPETAPFTLSPI